MDSSLKPSSSLSASKLPIKRKTPDSSSSLLSPKPEEQLQHHDQPISAVDFNDRINTKPPAFKFHRIWTEPDEIRFLQGLLDSATIGLSFPRDLHVFYDNFSNTMSQPYSKYQLSEKVRRLRKKFRVTSARISRGLNVSQLSLHDRSLYELSKKLWSPEYLPSSPFGRSSGNSNRLGEVGCYQTFQALRSNVGKDNGEWDFVNDDEGRICGVNVDMGYDFVGQQGKMIGGVVARSVVDVFDECLKEVRMGVANEGHLASGRGKEQDFERRWRDQRFAEFDVLTRRLRLVLEKSFNKQ